MALRRFWFAEGDFSQGEVSIQGELFHHIFDVCRFRGDQEFELLAPPGVAYRVSIVEISKKQARVRVLSCRELPQPTRPWVHLAVAISRFSTMDDIMEKSVELGVKSFHPFTSDFSFVRSHREISSARIERWQRIIRQATQQTGRGDLMQLEDVTSLDGIFDRVNREPESLCLFPYEGSCPRSVQNVLEEVHLAQLPSIWLIVGSEGGFSAPEMERGQARGIQPASFGEQILRVETACVALLGALKYRLGV